MSDRTSSILLVRRSFLTGLGVTLGGLALGSFASAAEPPKAAPPAKPADPKLKLAAANAGAGLQPNVFVHVAPDGLVTIACARSEMGQGVRSTLPALIADELGADMARVKIVQADGDKAYGDQNTDGSTSVRKAFTELRRTGAAARMMLVAAAAQRWKVPPASIQVRDHAVFHEATKRSFGFGELANEAAKLPVPKKDEIVLRPLSELRRVGKDMPFIDAPDIVTGRAVFGADVKLPGMLTAVIARPPVVGGRVAKHDPAKALAVKGVKRVVALPAPTPPFAFQPLGGIAVVAENTWAAMRGRELLDVTWDHGANASYDSTSYRAKLETSVRSPGRVVRNVGDADKALASSKRTVESVYYAPNLVHATMEPPVAVAKVDGGTCEVWASTQNPQASRTSVAKALGLDESNVTVHVTLLGGGFGRKSKPDYVVEAALLAKEMGAPVRVQWTREDDIRHDYYHSVSAQRLAAGLDEAGKIIAWHHRTAFPPIASLFKDASFAEPGQLSLGVLDVPLAIPNVRAENCEARAHTRIGWLRSVANIYHAFAVQSFIDELAHTRGIDPKDHLLEVYGSPRKWKPADLGLTELPNYGQSIDEHPVDTARHIRVLERVTELSGWKDRARSKRALGLAVHRSFLAYIAVVVSVVKDPSDKIRVDEAWIVADAGLVVNTERARSQFEGAVIFGLSHALYGEITMKGGATEQSNFRDFRLLRLPEAPRRIHVDILQSGAPPGGVGEPGVPPVATASCSPQAPGVGWAARRRSSASTASRCSSDIFAGFTRLAASPCSPSFAPKISVQHGRSRAPFRSLSRSSPRPRRARPPRSWSRFVTSLSTRTMPFSSRRSICCPQGSRPCAPSRRRSATRRQPRPRTAAVADIRRSFDPRCSRHTFVVRRHRCATSSRSSLGPVHVSRWTIPLWRATLTGRS
ncbi:MAG: Isoquinoline 1-oxidoreductase beta subunit, partial [Labilithrix sp.]|nr:Isoquinoline 1-oxidoreductase beta subunit [Labilithrix sp.]